MTIDYLFMKTDEILTMRLDKVMAFSAVNISGRPKWFGWACLLCDDINLESSIVWNECVDDAKIHLHDRHQAIK